VVRAQVRSTKSGVAIIAGDAPSGATAQSALSTDAAINHALLTSDADALAGLLADDWIVVSTQGRIGEKNNFVAYVRQGDFTRTKMELSEPRIRLYGDTAIVTTQLATAGHQLIEVDGKVVNKCFDVKERQSDVLVWGNGGWKSVLMHETKFPASNSNCT